MRVLGAVLLLSVVLLPAGRAAAAPPAEVLPSPFVPGRIRGRVLDDDGAPIAGVRIEARLAPPERRDADPDPLDDESPAGPPAAAGVTSADGAFLLDGLQAHEKYDVATWPRAPFTPSEQTFTADVHDDWLGQMTLRRDGRPLRLELRDPAGRPLEASVRLHSADFGRWDPWTVRSPRATAVHEFEAVPREVVWLVVLDPGRLAWSTRLDVSAVKGPVTVGPRGEGGVGGLVRGPDGHAVKGANVLLGIDPDGPEDSRLWVRQQTDANGAVRWPALPAGRLTVEVEAEGFLPERKIGTPGSEPLSVAKGRVTHVDFRLVRECRLEGRVLDETGAAIAGAALSLERTWFWDTPQSWGTDADGRYSVRVPPGPALVWAVSPLHGPDGPGWVPGVERASGWGTPMPVVLRAPGDRARLDLRLRRLPPPSVVMAGRCLDEAGQPIPGAVVTGQRWFNASLDPWEASSVSVMADAAGRFRFRATAQAWQAVEARAPGRRASQRLGCEGCPSADALTLVLKARGRFEGRVVDTEGKPVAGTVVWAEEPLDGFTPMRRDDVTRSRYGFTDADGRFSVEGGATAAGVSDPAWVVVGDRKVERPGPHEIVVRRAPQRLLTGRVVDGAEKPMPWRKVTAKSGDTTVGTITGADGVFRLRLPHDGIYDLGGDGLSERNGVAASTTGVVLTASMPPPEPYTDTRLRLFTRVRGEDGELVGGRDTWLGASAGEGTEELHPWLQDGLLEIPVLAGTARVSLTLRNPRDRFGRLLDLEDLEQTFDVAAWPSEIVLPRSPPLTGQVLDEAQRPVPGVVVYARASERMDSDDRLGSHWDLTGADGRFHVARPRGEHLMAVAAPSPWRVPAPQALPAAGKDLTVVLHRGAVIRGRVEAKDLPGMEPTLTARWPGSGAAAQVLHPVGKDGSFEVTVPEGVERIALTYVGDRHMGSSSARRTGLQAGDRDVVLQAGWTEYAFLRGRVRDSDGGDVSNVRVFVFPAGGEARRVVGEDDLFDGAAEFFVGPLEQGSYRVRVEPLDPAYGPVELDPEPVPQTDLDASLPASMEVTASGVDPRGPFEATWFRTLPDGTLAVSPGTSAADGTFTVRVARGTRGTLLVRGGGGSRGVLWSGPAEEVEGRAFVLVPSTGLQGRVAADSGAVPAGTTVVVAGAGWEVRVPAGPDGAFRADGLPPGALEVWPHAPDRPSRRERALAVPEGSRGSPVRVPLPPRAP